MASDPFYSILECVEGPEHKGKFFVGVVGSKPRYSYYIAAGPFDTFEQALRVIKGYKTPGPSITTDQAPCLDEPR